MVTSPAELEAMEKFFAATPLPKVFKLNAAVTINDLPLMSIKLLLPLKRRYSVTRLRGQGGMIWWR